MRETTSGCRRAASRDAVCSAACVMATARCRVTFLSVSADRLPAKSGNRSCGVSLVRDRVSLQVRVICAVSSGRVSAPTTSSARLGVCRFNRSPFVRHARQATSACSKLRFLLEECGAHSHATIRLFKIVVQLPTSNTLFGSTFTLRSYDSLVSYRSQTSPVRFRATFPGLSCSCLC